MDTSSRPPLLSPRAWLLIAAFLLRVAVAAAFPSLHHPDENFQFFEQAHRLAFGYGVVPWEFEDGMRSLLLPALFSGLIRALASAGASPLEYVFACRVVLDGLSLLIVATVYDCGRRISTRHALIGGVVAASWFELVYFAGRPLSEAMATDFLVAALALASPARALGRSTLGWIGAAIGASLMLRLQLAPGLAVLAVWVCGADWRGRWRPMLAGAAAPVALFAISDWVSWGSPFHSQIAALEINWVKGKASIYGTEPPAWYVTDLLARWSAMLPVVAALLFVRRRAYAAWIAVALVLIAAHSLIPHKEYRFVFPALACLVLAAALASADMVEYLRRRFPAHARTASIAVCALWLVASYVLAVRPAFSFYWFKDANVLSAESALSHRPELCGLWIYDVPWYETGGYAFLHRDVPIYRRMAQPPMEKLERAANVVIAHRASLASLPSSYVTGSCLGTGSPGDFCVIARPGACQGDRALPSMLEEHRLGE